MPYDPLDNDDSGTLVSDIITDVQDCMAFLVLMTRRRSDLFTDEELSFAAQLEELIDPFLLMETDDDE